MALVAPINSSAPNTYLEFLVSPRLIHDIVNVSYYDLNVEFLSFFKKNYKFHCIGVLSQDSAKK